ncbi:5'-nucleotidase SurE [Polymorphobacter glacialis]|uniref:5'-nucleotidase SurE n=1 Tax=Sandarakinorhabdus glacialis TaxID=1614636 RepID=A0A917A0K3_9SPHN|nr:5'/3'-nucleotidase SurE [Polymorphobacter glacialis]GGE21179.1 5'-nucleotidase SurE [Polymorphobacter glacialis]
MRILVTNDDGISAPGLVALEAIAAELSDDVWVVAPAEEQSGAGHSLTLSQPVRIREISPRRYSVRGTPTDCVMLALGAVMKDHKPDLILSGVNRGGNLAEDVTYSGTVSAAMEGCLAGIRSIALSQVMSNYTMGMEDFSTAATHGAAIIRLVQTVDWPAGVLVNINFPPVAADAIKGVRVTQQGFRDYGNISLVERIDPRGFPYYWHGFGKENLIPGHDTDLKAMHEAMISVTPLHLDMTHYQTMAALKAVLAPLAEI